MKYILIKVNEVTKRPVGWENPCEEPHWGGDSEASGMEEIMFEEGADAIIASGKEVDLDEAYRKYDDYIITECDMAVPICPPKPFTQFIEEEL